MHIITSLTDDQVDKQLEYVKRWQSIVLDTTRADRPTAEASIRASYQLVGKIPPRQIIWCSSPIGAIIAQQFAQITGKTVGLPAAHFGDDSIDDSMIKSALDNVSAYLAPEIWNSARSLFLDGTIPNLRYLVTRHWWGDEKPIITDAVWEYVKSWLDKSTEIPIKPSVWSTVKDTIRDKNWVCHFQHVFAHDGWLAFFDYFRDVCGLVSQTDCVQGLTQVARAALVWWPYANCAWVCERPIRITQDDRGQIHNEVGPAIVFRDGWGLWAWHGVLVPPFVIEQPSTISIEQIENASDLDLRRAIIERFGISRYLMQSGAEEIAHDDYGTLWRKWQPDDEPLVMVQLKKLTARPDGTFNDSFIRVPPTIKTPYQAVMWSLDNDEYRPPTFS